MKKVILFISVVLMVVFSGCAGSEGNILKYSSSPFGLNKIKKAIDNGENINTTNRYGENALHIALNYCNKDTVEYLLSHGINTTHKNNNGDTPLMAALTYRLMGGRTDSLYCKNSIIAVINEKSSINIPNKKGEYPIYIASFKKFPINNIFVATMILNGANLDILPQDQKQEILKNITDPNIKQYILTKDKKYLVILKKFYGNYLNYNIKTIKDSNCEALEMAYRLNNDAAILQMLKKHKCINNKNEYIDASLYSNVMKYLYAHPNEYDTLVKVIKRLENAHQDKKKIKSVFNGIKKKEIYAGLLLKDYIKSYTYSWNGEITKYLVLNTKDKTNIPLEVLKNYMKYDFDFLVKLHKNFDLSSYFEILLDADSDYKLKKLIAIGIKPTPKYMDAFKRLYSKIYLPKSELSKQQVRNALYLVKYYAKYLQFNPEGKKLDLLYDLALDRIYSNIPAERYKYTVIKRTLDYGVDMFYKKRRLLNKLGALYENIRKRDTISWRGRRMLAKLKRDYYDLYQTYKDVNPIPFYAKLNNLEALKYYYYEYEDNKNATFNSHNALYYAIKNNNFEMVEFLIYKNLKPSLEDFKLSLNKDLRISVFIFNFLDDKEKALNLSLSKYSLFSKLLEEVPNKVNCNIIGSSVEKNDNRLINIISKHAQNKVKKCIDKKLKKAYNEIKSISEYHKGAIDLAKAQKMANAYKIDIKEKITKVEKLKKALYPKYQKYVEELMARQKKEYEERKRARSRYVSVSIRDCYNKTCSVDVNGNYAGTIAYWWKSSSGGYYVINYKSKNGGLLGRSGHYHPNLHEVYMSCGTKRRVYSLKQAMKYVVKCAVSGHY